MQSIPNNRLFQQSAPFHSSKKFYLLMRTFYPNVVLTDYKENQLPRVKFNNQFFQHMRSSSKPFLNNQVLHINYELSTVAKNLTSIKSHNRDSPKAKLSHLLLATLVA